MGRGRDEIDLMCEKWAAVRRELVGIRRPLLAKDYIGAPKSTMARIKDLHDGAQFGGRMEQHWPEFPYTGDLYCVNQVIRASCPALKEIADWHYVLLSPRNKGIRADLMGISLRVYWDRVSRLKERIDAGISILSTVRTEGRETYVR